MQTFESREIPLILNYHEKITIHRSSFVQALQKHESGIATGVICREMGIAPATLSKWKAQYGGLDVSDVQKLKTLEEEHSRLKRMYADLAMDNQLLRDLFSKKAGPCHQTANSRRIGTRSRRTGEQGLQTSFHSKISVLLPKCQGRQRHHRIVAGIVRATPNLRFS